MRSVHGGVWSMIRFSSIYYFRHCLAHQFCKEGWSIPTSSGGKQEILAARAVPTYLMVELTGSGVSQG